MNPPTATPQTSPVATLFLIEDNDAVRTVAEITLKTLNYIVLTAPSGLEAIARWPQLKNVVDLVITDMAMPGGIDGLTLLERMRAERPGLKAILTTGDEARSLSKAVQSNPLQAILHKPYQASALDGTIRSLLGLS